MLAWLSLSRILLFLMTVVIVVVGGLITMAVLAFVGSPGACGEGSAGSTAARASFQQKWDPFDADLKAGRSSQVTFTEEELAARGAAWIEEEDLPIKDLKVYLCPGEGQASGNIDIGPATIDALVGGNLDLSGPKPRINIETARVGSVPGWLTGWVVDRIESVAKLDEIDINPGITRVDIEENQATLRGGP